MYIYVKYNLKLLFLKKPFLFHVCRSENGPHRYSDTVKLLIIITINIAVTYLCVVWFGKSIIEIPTSSDHDKEMVHDRENNLYIAVNALNVTEKSVVRMLDKEQVPENYTAYEYLKMNSRT